MYGSNFEFSSYDRVSEFLAEAEKEALVRYAKQTSSLKARGFRQKLGLTLVYLGQQLSGELKAA
jgi:hypothetical protein